jgi:hypothetical protein
MTPETKSASSLGRKEVQLLLTLAKPRMLEEDKARLVRLLEGGAPLNWTFLLDQAVRQQVISVVGRNLLRYMPMHRVLVPHAWIYIAAYEANSRRNRALFTELQRIVAIFEQRGIQYVLRKGPVLCSLVYGDAGIRRMNDLDLLVDRACAAAIAAALSDLGYAQGTPSPTGSRIEPPKRETEIFWSVHLNNALPFIKLTSDPDVGVFNIDLCFDLFQKQSPGALSVDTVFGQARTIGLQDDTYRAMSPEHHLLDVCLHLYKEATSYLSISRGRDCVLMRFVDVAETIRTMGVAEQDGFADLAERVCATREVYYALHFTNELIPNVVPASVLTRMHPGDLAFLDEYGSLEGRTRRWRRGFPDRLFDTDRALEIPAASTIPVI